RPLPVAAITVAACTATPASGPDNTAAGRGRGASAAAPPVPVTVSEVVQKSMPLEVRAIGSAEAALTVAVRAQITGALTSVHFQDGDDVTEGQPLFGIDRRPLEAAVKQAEATLQLDAAQAANAPEHAKPVS